MAVVAPVRGNPGCLSGRGRDGPFGPPPRTEPDVRDYRIRLFDFDSGVCCGPLWSAPCGGGSVAHRDPHPLVYSDPARGCWTPSVSLRGSPLPNNRITSLRTSTEPPNGGVTVP